MNISDASIGMMVVLPSGEHGRVSHVDDEENMLHVDVAAANGLETIDVDASEVEPRD